MSSTNILPPITLQPKKKKWDVMALGNIAVDDLMYVSAYPPADSKVRVSHSQRQCGGLSATALVAASRLGASCIYAGVLGENELSRFAEATLLREGIEVSHIVRSSDASPSHSIIIVDTERCTRNIFFEVKGRCGADAEQPTEEIIRFARVLLIDPWGEAGMLRAAKIAREANIPIVCDFERNDFPAFEELLALSNHAILPDDFAMRLTQTSSASDAARALWNETRQCVVVTCGKDGGVAISQEYSDCEPRHYDAFPVETVDTTGCGDVFHGAYAAALAREMAIDERLRFAAATAAIKATQIGGQAGIPARAAVEEFLSRVS